MLLRISASEQMKQAQSFRYRERFPHRTGRMFILHVCQNQPNSALIILVLQRNLPHLGHQWNQCTLLFELLLESKSKRHQSLLFSAPLNLLSNDGGRIAKMAVFG